MSASSRDLERALGAFLSLDVREVEHAGVTFANFGLRPRKNLRTLEVIGELDQRLRRDDLDFGTGPGRFGSACVRADQALAASVDDRNIEKSSVVCGAYSHRQSCFWLLRYAFRQRSSGRITGVRLTTGRQ